MSRRQEWESMSPEAQFAMICRCIGKAASRLHVKINAADLAGEVWLRVTTRIEECPEESLLLTVYREAHNATQQEARHNRKFAEADNFTVAGADGDGLGQVLDLVADSGNVEAVAILRVDFGRFYDTLDASNKKLVSGRAAGYLFREIGPTLPKKMSHAAMEHRLSRLEKRVAAFMG